MESDVKKITERVKQESDFVNTLMYEVGKVIVGQKYLIERLLIGILSNGHVLLEGVPGLAKTMSVVTLAKALQAGFQRIQFTPDLLPADLIGTLIYNPKSGDFTVRKGPIFTNIVLADEINRAPAKVQSALLEAMQERQVTIGDETFKLPAPFLVLATQNPIEQEGTYPLPEAQVDRFMLKVLVDYPDKAQELEILKKTSFSDPELIRPVINCDELSSMSRLMDEIYVDEKLKEYIVNLVSATRDPKAYGMDTAGYIQYGASPRATIFLARAARVNAFLAGRGYVTPQDIKQVGPDVLRHRIILSFEAEAEEVSCEDIVRTLFDSVEVP